MIGVFDSGVGGLCAYEQLKELLPNEKIFYLKDTENAPYGTKTKSEVLTFTKKNIRTLCELGAERILIACCTASGLWSELSEEEKRISTPIIYPAAKEAARLAHGGTVAVISTELTAKNHTFKRAIEEIDPTVSVCEIGEQMLVGLVELGARDGVLFPRESELIDSISADIKNIGASALILGCTHFSHLKEEFKSRLGKINIIDTARLGAKFLASEYLNSKVK